MPTIQTHFLLVLTVFLVLSPSPTYGFGAGDIPDFAYLNDKAFRHGDIESILENLVKHAGGPALGGGLLGFATSVLKTAAGGAKFSKMDVKRVYFGNWLRDYSQAMDIAGLSKLTADTITLIISVLGFMTFGFASREFEVTQDRLGVYLPVEHIDNPKGYAEKEGDARQIHPKLRPPVDQRELEIDERTGMKNYMASENEGWDTSTAFIRRTLKACIDHGRRAEGQENDDLFEAFRLLGTGLHTLEDLLAHSNWCEVALRKMGHDEVFCHVGDNVVVETPNGPAPPLVTGTFGGADFLHSLLGEAGDKLSQASVTDLADKMNQASEGGDSNVSAFKAILNKLPVGGNEDKMSQSDEIHEQSKAYHFDPNNVAPPEVQRQLFDLLKWRDTIMRDITEKIEMVPGLSELVDEFTNALNAYVYTILAPYVVPMITQVSGVLDEGSKAVINNDDQYQVFDDPDASDPSHSLLSKDHFALILNEPAGKIAQVVVEYAVNLIVRAWSDDSDPDSVLDIILEAFHHPYYATGNSEIQNKMFEHMETWLGGLGPDTAGQVIGRLTSQSVRDHKNKRIGSEDMSFEEPGYATSYIRPQGSSQGYAQKSQYSDGADTYPGGGYSNRGDGYSGDTYTGRGDQTRESGRYGQQGSYGRVGYGQENISGRSGDYSNNYSQDSYNSQRRESQEYGLRGRAEDENRTSYGEAYQGSYGGGYPQEGRRQENEGYGDGSQSYGGYNPSSHSDGQSHGPQRDDGNDQSQGYAPSYGRDESDRYGRNETYDGRREEFGGSQDYRGPNDGYGGRSVEYRGSSNDRDPAYNPNYGSDETFGAERLGLRDDDGDGYGERRHGHSHHHHRKHSDD